MQVVFFMTMNKKLFWIFSLSSSVYFLQGLEALPAQGLFYYLKETLMMPVEKIMLLSSLTMAAWVIKPIIGYLIDNLLTKKAWIFISLGIAIVLALALGFLGLSVGVLVVLLFFSSTAASFRDVSADGIMCVEGKAYNATGKIQSVQWISLYAAGIITGIGGGYIAEKWGYQKGFLWLVPFYLSAAAITCFYRPGLRLAEAKRNLLADLRKIFSDQRLLIVALFIFLYKYSPSFGTPLFFIQRDTFKWGKLYIGSLATASTLFGIGGSLLYYKFSQRINLKKWLYFSVFIGALTTFSYLYYTPASAVIYEILYSFMGMFIFLMLMDFMARNTMPGLEATSFAFLCSVSNLALVSSNLSGAYLLPLIGLKWLIVISSLTSFFCLGLIKKIA
jgi:MFS family permease